MANDLLQRLPEITAPHNGMPPCPALNTVAEFLLQAIRICEIFQYMRVGPHSDNAVSQDLAPVLEQSLEFFPKKFNKHITNECGYNSDLKIGRRKNILERPNQSLAPHCSRTFKFPHK